MACSTTSSLGDGEQLAMECTEMSFLPSAIPIRIESKAPALDSQQSSSSQQLIAQLSTVQHFNGSPNESTVAKDIHPCSICGDRARYVFYGTRACDSCRTFFRRHVVLNSSKPLRCRFRGHCDLRLKNRKFCPACRLAKCKSVGMKSELVAFDSANFEVSSALSFPCENSSTHNFDQSYKHLGPGYEVHYVCELLRTSIPRSMPPCDFTIKSGDNYVILKRLGWFQISRIQELAFAGNEFKELIPVHLESDTPANTIEAFMATLTAGTQKVLISARRLALFDILEFEDVKLMSKDCIVGCILILSLFALDSTMSFWTTTCFQPNDFEIPNRLSIECLRFAKDGNQLYRNYMRLVRTFREVPLWRRDPFFLSLFSAIAFFTPKEKLKKEDDIIRDRHIYTTLIGRYLEEIFGRERSSECHMAMATMYSCLAQIIELRNQFSQIEMGCDLPA